MEYSTKITGQIVGMLRVRKGYSQETLAGLAGIARTHLTAIENGTKCAGVDTLWRIASALDIRLSDLIRLVETRMEEQQE